MKTLKKIIVEDPELKRVHDGLSEAIDPLTKNVLMNGQLLTKLILKSGQDNLISHKLGRFYLGWINCGNLSSSTIFESISPDKIKFLNLHCSSDTVINIYVF